MSHEELSELKTCADAFATGEGPALQAALVAKDAARYSSFISEPWFDMYLRDNAPLLLNYNPQARSEGCERSAFRPVARRPAGHHLS